MKKITSLILSSIVLWTTQSTIAADSRVVIGGVEMPQVETSVAFEQMKKKMGRPVNARTNRRCNRRFL